MFNCSMGYIWPMGWRLSTPGLKHGSWDSWVLSQLCVGAGCLIKAVVRNVFGQQAGWAVARPFAGQIHLVWIQYRAVMAESHLAMQSGAGGILAPSWPYEWGGKGGNIVAQPLAGWGHGPALPHLVPEGGGRRIPHSGGRGLNPTPGGTGV